MCVAKWGFSFKFVWLQPYMGSFWLPLPRLCTYQAAIEVNVYSHLIEHVSFLQLAAVCWTWGLQLQIGSVSYPQVIYIFRARRQERKVYPLIPGCLLYDLYRQLRWVSYFETIRIWEMVHFLTWPSLHTSRAQSRTNIKGRNWDRST